MNTIIIIIIAVSFFVLGYGFCYLRNSVGDTKKMLEIFISLTAGEITNDEALERVKEINSKYEN